MSYEKNELIHAVSRSFEIFSLIEYFKQSRQQQRYCDGRPCWFDDGSCQEPEELPEKEK